MQNVNGGTTAPKTGIEAIETFIAEIPACTLEQALAKFQGRRTPKTLAAAQRIVAKKKRVKIPRHLLRQLWRITGGWQGIMAGKDSNYGVVCPIENPVAVPQFLETAGKIKIGDLEVAVQMENNTAGLAVLVYRGVAVARVASKHGNRYIWNDAAKVNGALAAKLG